MRIRHLLIYIAIAINPVLLHGQDHANFTQFYLNPYILNPSFAGIDGKASVGLIYKRQWMTLDGGPSIVNFSFHAPINTKLSTGLNVTNDSRGLLNNTSLLFSLGYNVAFKNTSYLRFGASAGGSWNTVDINELQGLNDQALANLSGSHASLAGNAGLSYHYKAFHIGFALPYIFAPSVLSENGFTVSEASAFKSSIIHTSVRFYAKRSPIVFEPYLLYRLNTTAPSQLEAAAILHLNNAVWLGGTYKQDFGISGVGGIKLKNMLAIGLAYSVQNAGENRLNSPSFEISLNYLIGTRKKGTYAYSFVDTHKEKPKKHPYHAAGDEIARKHKEAEEARKKQLNEQARRKEAEEQAKHQALVQQKIVERKNEVVKPIEPAPDTAKAGHNPRFKQQLQTTAPVIAEGHPEHEEEQLNRLEVHAADAKEQHNEEGHPHAERHEFVKRGNHEKELETGDYVVGGVFRGELNAQHFSEGLNKLGFHSHYGHLTEKNLWYTYVMKTDDINTAKAERDKARKMKILKDAWLLTVHH
jgi:type IX secretion system PorP/SprF family membrane protein